MKLIQHFIKNIDKTNDDSDDEDCDENDLNYADKHQNPLD